MQRQQGGINCKNSINYFVTPGNIYQYYTQALAHLPHDSNPIRDYKDLVQLPILTKEMVRSYKNLMRSGARRTSVRSTSGSTGEPLIFFKDREATAYMDAVMYQTYSWCGIQIGNRQARFWGLPFDPKARLREQIKDFLMNRIRLSAFDISDRSLMAFYKKMLRFRPQYCYGYPSLMHEFACFLEGNGLSLHKLGLKAVIVTGEQVIMQQLKVIEQVFAAQVVNEYGCTEVGVLAFQCKKGKMHVMAPNIILEVIKDGKQVTDEEGEIYVTELNAKEMPFIRYRIGDIGVLSSELCTCGVNFPVVKIITGRMDDYILTPEGERVYDAIFAYTFKHGIKVFRAVQEKINLINIYAVIDSDYSKTTEIEYIKKLKKYISKILNLILYMSIS